MTQNEKEDEMMRPRVVIELKIVVNREDVPIILSPDEEGEGPLVEAGN
jgi:hypothetical protein